MYSRHTLAQSSAVRKPRVDGKPSMLPKPRRPGSTDRASVEARRPSAAHRSSSAEPARATFGRLSRDASATKVPLNHRSRSQQSDRLGSMATPLRSTYLRATTTPVRTPSEDRMSRSWQVSVERALAFLTVKDQRQISNAAWQRAECARVQEALAARGQAGEGGGLGLIRPLTITRFVDITGGLLAAIMLERNRHKLNNDNYVAKLPNLAKRFLYPGTVSKSWLKTVNTLHAFPHALAFISYFLDIAEHIETPISEESLYLEKDEQACLRREFLYKSWIRFQEPDATFEDLNEEYLQQLRRLLGDDALRVKQLEEAILKYETNLDDEGEKAAQAEEERLRARRDMLAGAVRGARAERRNIRSAAGEQAARRTDHAGLARSLDTDIANATAEIQQLKKELDEQSITVAERARLLDEVDYATRVIDSKRTLAEQISKMVLSKETELALWQKRTLDSCVEYKQGLIHLSAQFPHLASLTIDEKELMEAACAQAVARAVDALRAHAQRLADQRAEHARARSAHARQRITELEETRVKIIELKSSIERSQQALASEAAREAGEAAAWAGERRELAARLDELLAGRETYAQAHTELQFWEKQDAKWRTKLAEVQEYTASLREEISRELQSAKRRSADSVIEMVQEWQARLAALDVGEQTAADHCAA